MKSILAVLGFLVVFLVSGGQSNDERCSCKCPETYWIDPSIETDFPERKVYINSTVRAVDCDCEHVVQPVLNLNESQVEKMCPRCKCKHEERSTTTIKVVVIIILWILSVLIIYLGYLVCVDPLLKGQPIQVRGRLNSSLPYQQQSNDTESLDNDSTPMRSYPPGGGGGGGGLANRLGREQDRWKRAVENQRSSVYLRHTMLN